MKTDGETTETRLAPHTITFREPPKNGGQYNLVARMGEIKMSITHAQYNYRPSCERARGF